MRMYWSVDWSVTDAGGKNGGMHGEQCGDTMSDRAPRFRRFGCVRSRVEPKPGPKRLIYHVVLQKA